MTPQRSAIFAATLTLAACASPLPAVKPPTLLQQAPLRGIEVASVGAWPKNDWWKRYDDPTLDRLVDSALAAAPSLQAAEARIQGARAAVRVLGAAAGARVAASASIQRQRLSDNGLFPPEFLGFNWYNQTDVGLGATYTFDWWGKQRASIESAIDSVRAAAAEKRAAALSLTSLIAESYFGWQSDQARLGIKREQLTHLERNAAILAARAAADLEPGDALAQADSERAATRAQIQSLESDAQMRLIELAALVGCAPAELPPLAPRTLPAVGAQLPDRLSLDLISRRPDIAASRWRVEAARRGIDVARADYYPDISIKALIGLQSLDIGKLLETGSTVPAVGAAVNLPLFDSGLRAAHLGASRFQFNAAVTSYNETVIAAARDVARQATARAYLTAQSSESLQELAAASRLASLAQAREREGLVDARPGISALLSVLDRKEALVQVAQAALAADISLQRALGGGFEINSEIGQQYE
jgi:outer membrane protein, multidrug efflux system